MIHLVLLATLVTVAKAAPYYDPYYDPYGYGYAPFYGYEQQYPNYPANPYPPPAYPEPYAAAYPGQYPAYPNSYVGGYPNYPQPQHSYYPYNGYPQQANQSPQANLYGNRVVSANKGQNRGDANQGGLVDFDPKTVMNDARKYAQSTRAVADLVDNVGNTATQNKAIGGLASLFGGAANAGGQGIGTTLNGISSVIRSSASLMEQGTGTMIQIRDQLSSLGT
ncbi:hypothetical protein TCAL_12671 [Tigriopus californicus]|uniref:Uncharacterized protein n=1 Tax=Tigriopus californicus TaxID=6832 RepID=A0A553P4J7_TIGCA|nr:uncharacterized protein LOC131883548 [Tigriopus californicus]TRY72609.1 hypothetical protein TCAL_12671 [Tigriopus californicus]|eukprot:TCALIF_12671-PA protein Name:"Protein of unknown function" AED:0.00 eAED:0.00 QI:134/1/1/1/1/1/3/148/221